MNIEDVKQCTAHKKNGARCLNKPVFGYTVCSKHGAGAPKKGRPGGHPITSGRWSRFLPTRLIDRYEASLEDGELLNLREDISVIDARIADVMSRVDTGEAGELWRAAQDAHAGLQAAITSQNVTAMQKSLFIMSGILEKGAGDYNAWSEVVSLIEQRRKMVESERKRLVEMNQMITAESALILIMAVTDVVKSNVTNPEELSAIIYGITKIMVEGGISRKRERDKLAALEAESNG